MIPITTTIDLYNKPLEEVLRAHQVRELLNLANLQHYIQPTRNRADLPP